MNKKLLLIAILMLSVTFGFSQTKEELQAQKAEKQAEANKFQGEANAIQKQIDALPGWRKGAFGTIGGSLSNFILLMVSQIKLKTNIFGETH